MPKQNQLTVLHHFCKYKDNTIKQTFNIKNKLMNKHTNNLTNTFNNQNKQSKTKISNTVN